jgi:hypothetical protein
MFVPYVQVVCAMLDAPGRKLRGALCMVQVTRLPRYLLEVKWHACIRQVSQRGQEQHKGTGVALARERLFDPGTFVLAIVCFQAHHADAGVGRTSSITAESRTVCAVPQPHCRMLEACS